MSILDLKCIKKTSESLQQVLYNYFINCSMPTFESIHSDRYRHQCAICPNPIFQMFIDTIHYCSLFPILNFAFRNFVFEKSMNYVEFPHYKMIFFFFFIPNNSGNHSPNDPLHYIINLIFSPILWAFPETSTKSIYFSSFKN